MIARVWKGWTAPDKADEYERVLKTDILPGFNRLEGYRGGYIMRSTEDDEVEFIVISLFDSLENVKKFAGTDHTVPVIEPQARRVLSRIEPLARHYTVSLGPDEIKKLVK